MQYYLLMKIIFYVGQDAVLDNNCEQKDYFVI